MNEWPTELNIHGVTYSIEYCSNIDDVDPRGDADGIVLLGKKKIKILIKDFGQTYSSARVFSVMLHEIVHAVFEESPLLLECVQKREEKFVEQFSKTLTDTLIRNNIVILPDEEMGNNG